MKSISTLCQFRITLLFALLVVSSLTPLAAGDGALEINQACVATGCFPGDPPGFPVLITESGSYILTSNLEVPSENLTAIESTADVMWLDLGGFMISGITQCSGNPTVCTPLGSGRGIDVELNKEGSVRNGTVQGMGESGIRVGRGIVENVTVRGNGDNGIVNSGGTTRGSRVIFNGGAGISSGGGIVIDNEVSGNGLTGISGTVGPYIRGNRVRLNGGVNDSPGIQTSDGFVIDNHLMFNRGPGLIAGGSTVYGNNAFRSNNLAQGPSAANQVTGGGTQLDANVCQGVPCP